MKVNILGTEYTIEYKDDEEVCRGMQCQPGMCGGYCNEFSHEIVIANLNLCNDGKEAKEELRKRNVRHEITHAFLNESGLSANSSESECWAKNEEMVDWISIQFPKILEVFREVGVI